MPDLIDRFVRAPACRAALVVVSALAAGAAQADSTVTLGGFTLVSHGLVGVGRIPADRRDKFGETFGSGSGMALDPKSWRRAGAHYRGTLFLLPDRGYNVSGTTDYRSRLNTIAIDFTPTADPSKLPADARQRTVRPRLADTMLLVDAAGVPLTGLDPIAGGIRPAAGNFPAMPQAPNGHIALDSEGVVRLRDGSFFISDEYGPYIYRFSAKGRMLGAIRPPDAFIPRRNGQDNFSSNNPGPGQSAPVPPNPETGRQNNQGFEGLALTPDGKYLVAILQSATRQDGGDAPETRDHTRMLYYDISAVDHPVLVREHVVRLPSFETADGKHRIAAQSELLALDADRFLLLCRDAGNGYGLEGATSRYRRIELLDTSGATDIAGSKYDGLAPVAPKGRLAEGVVPAALKTFIDINDNAELAKFGLHNGPPQDRNNLYEKWEAMGLVPALDPKTPNDYFLFVADDNDFITQHGFQVGAPYKDASGVDVDTMFLVYRVTLPEAKR
ncbi:MAG TPA: esterase-like activity of phytase family protein [Xanthobacteraceae bacterium]|nr:esterase-like activity of phytase family protein [Xanthobacteraceae bacterium]